MRKPLKTLTQTNLENAIANLDDLSEELTELSEMRTLPLRAMRRVIKALQLAAIARSHFVTVDSISEDRLYAKENSRTGSHS
jgi:hypothetical protein